jgi:predicted nucleotidyltransferase
MIALQMNTLDTNAPGIDDARASSRRLTDLLRREHSAMADFLVALADFDRQRLWLGHSSLFYFLHRELGLSKGAAHFRKVAAQLVHQFPEVVEPLRDGRLCISSVVELARVMTPENRVEAMPRFFHRSKREAKEVAMEIQPAAVIPRREVVMELPRSIAVRPDEPGPIVPEIKTLTPQLTSEPLTFDLRRLHMTVSKQFLEKLESARKGQGHAQPGASAEKVLEAALDLLLAVQGKRRAEVKKPQQNPRPTKNPSHVPAAVKRAVWARDEGKCQWPLDSGGVCGSTLRLEIDHIRPLARGGKSTVANCRLACCFHNQLAARQVYGDDWMDQFTRRAGEGTAGQVPVAREPSVGWKVGPVAMEDRVSTWAGWSDRRRIAEFCQRHHVRRLALFGSVLRDDFTPSSDVDVLVEFEPGHVPGLAFFSMENELSGIVGRKVDLNTPGFLSRHFRDRVLAEAETQYVAA